MKKTVANFLWILVAIAGAWAYATLAFHRGEPLNSAYILVAALCTYTIGYRFYSKWIAARVLMLNDRRATPCEVHDDGKDFVKTNKWIVFGHHFAAISGPGPLVGPVLAAQFGYLPGTLWILIGVVLGGAVQDFVILFCSIRRDGKSLAQMIKEELGTAAGRGGGRGGAGDPDHPAGRARAGGRQCAGRRVRGACSPWERRSRSRCSWAATCGSGGWGESGKSLSSASCCCCWRCGAGNTSITSRRWPRFFSLGKEPIAWSVILYGLAASVLPVWLLLAPRDYLSTFMKLGTIFALAFGVLVVLPDLKMPALTRFTEGTGPVVPGGVFPFCFITIACGAISGFHTLVASGITPKIITRESYARPVGYGAMCLESLVAIMAMIAACTLEPGVYLSMNVDVGDLPVAEKVVATAAKVTGEGFPVTAEHDDEPGRAGGRAQPRRQDRRRGDAGGGHGRHLLAA